MAHQVATVILRCETAAETEHLGNKSVYRTILLYKTFMNDLCMSA